MKQANRGATGLAAGGLPCQELGPFCCSARNVAANVAVRRTLTQQELGSDEASHANSVRDLGCRRGDPNPHEVALNGF